MRLEIVPASTLTRLSSLEGKPSLFERILEGQKTDAQLKFARDESALDHEGNFSEDTDGATYSRGRICVPDLLGLKEETLTEAHCAPYVAHPDSTKVYRDLK